MQKRQANPKLPSKSLILIGSRQGTDGKRISSSASVRRCSSSCSVTTDTPSGCRLARGSPERGRRVVRYVTALSLPAQPEPPTQQDAARTPWPSPKESPYERRQLVARARASLWRVCSNRWHRPDGNDQPFNAISVDEQHNSIRKNTYGSGGKPDRSKKASLFDHLVGEAHARQQDRSYQDFKRRENSSRR
jgi:hypothetical protein